MSALVLIFLVALGAVAVGVLIGRYYVPDDRALRRGARQAQAYVRVINLLLSREPEAAIAGLRDVVDENVDDIEPYFALGALFRSRGEWERAIRVHQSIELRKPGSRGTRLRVRYELGLDFRAAGMPRRATKAMEECLEINGKHAGALRALCGLYEEQGRYREAASSWARLAKHGEPRSVRELHLLAAAAQRALAAADLKEAKSLLKTAMELGSEHPHVLVAAAELAAAEGDATTAQQQLKAALRADSGLVGYVLPRLRRIHADVLFGKGASRADDEKVHEAVAATLQEVAEGHEQATPLRLALADTTARFAPERAVASLTALATDEPTLIPARVAAARIALASNNEDQIREELNKLAGSEGAMAWTLDGEWTCTSCGHGQSDFFWRCSQCRHWGTAGPNFGERGGGRGRDRRQENRPGAAPVGSPNAPPHQTEDRKGTSAPEGAVGRASSWIAEAFRSGRS